MKKVYSPWLLHVWNFDNDQENRQFNEGALVWFKLDSHGSPEENHRIVESFKSDSLWSSEIKIYDLAAGSFATTIPVSWSKTSKSKRGLRLTSETEDAEEDIIKTLDSIVAEYPNSEENAAQTKAVKKRNLQEQSGSSAKRRK